MRTYLRFIVKFNNHPGNVSLIILQVINFTARCSYRIVSIMYFLG